MTALRNVRHWLAENWGCLVLLGLLCLPTVVWPILYLCGVVARGPM